MVFLRLIICPAYHSIIYYRSSKSRIQYNATDIEEWDPDTPRDVGRYILPNATTTIVFPRNLEKHKSYDILMMVASDPRNYEKRIAIRRTWGRDQNRNGNFVLGLVFLVGLTHDLKVTHP